MKVTVLAVLVAVANATSLTYTTGHVKILPHSDITVSGIPRQPERISRVEETGDALGNRAGGFVSRDSEGNMRTVRYRSAPVEGDGGHQQREAVYGIRASTPERYSYDSEARRPHAYRYGNVPSSRSVSFSSPLADTYPLFPQFPYHGSVRRYF